MTADVASAMANETEPSTPLAHPVLPTGYRVAVVPGAIEVSARLGTPEEVRSLMKVLGANCTILEDAAEGDTDEPLNLTKRVARLVAEDRQSRFKSTPPKE
jgi:hypothetical protein